MVKSAAIQLVKYWLPLTRFVEIKIECKQPLNLPEGIMQEKNIVYITHKQGTTVW